MPDSSKDCINPFRRDCDLQGEPQFLEVLLAVRFVACLAGSRDHKCIDLKSAPGLFQLVELLQTKMQLSSPKQYDDGSGMATAEEKEQALQSAFPDPDRVIEILKAAAVNEYEKAGAARDVTKSSGKRPGFRSDADADVDMNEHGNQPVSRLPILNLRFHFCPAGEAC